MPRYFFHTQVAGDVVTDPTGTELRDPDQAWEIAQATIRSTLADAQGASSLMGAVLVVTDAAGAIVMECPFAEAVLPLAESPGTRH